MKYKSRKLIITVYCMLLALLFASVGIISPELTLVLLSGASSYPVANAWSGRKGKDTSGYASRKFNVTFCGITIAALSTLLGIMTPGLSQVLLAGIASYNITNAWVEPDAG